MNKKLILGLFVIIGLYFPLSKAIGALPGCGCDCGKQLDSGMNLIGCIGYYTTIGWSPWSSCTINPIASGYVGSTGSSCDSGNSHCHTGYCPVDPSILNGDPCRIYYNASEWGSCVCKGIDGVWDGDDSACIKCNGTKTEAIKMADTSKIYGKTDAGDGNCEDLCGASPECDEVANISGVVVSGGVCDNCVFGLAPPPPPCSWQNDACGQDPCAADERHQTCGPTGCSANCDGQPPGSTRCVADLTCLPCEDTCTCVCPNECPSPGGECRGGLVPCGRSCDDPCTEICESCPCTFCHLFVLLKRIVDFVTINIIFPLAALMFVIGGVFLLTAAGDPGRIGQGKKILTAVVIGLVIILAAWLIVNTIITFLTPASSPFQAWHTIDCLVP